MNSLKAHFVRTRRFWITVSVSAVIFSSGLLMAGSKEKTPKLCQFTNPSYAGVCTVQPKGDETCKGILAYLNQANSAGKTYCNDTIIRGGWKKANSPDLKNKPKTNKP